MGQIGRFVIPNEVRNLWNPSGNKSEIPRKLGMTMIVRDFWG